MTMQGFDEYAALARHLYELQRSGERTTEQAAARRESTGDAIDQLGQRLTMQQQRLTELAQLIGEPLPQWNAPAPLPPLSVTGHLGSPPGPSPQGGVAGQETYPELAAGPDRVALTTTPAPTPSVPGPRLPTSGAYAPPTQQFPQPAPAVPVNPDAELDLAYRAAAAADEAAERVESQAGQPAFLPTASPFGRALAAYLIFIAVANIPQWLLGDGYKSGEVGWFTALAWMLAGLPALAFFGAYISLTIWGRPRLGASQPNLYARLGFFLCFLVLAISTCFWVTP
ncbi:hypothetical protein [Micromonospora pisi]|nr:hypothetical protein [Micromonospora pisi]